MEYQIDPHAHLGSEISRITADGLDEALARLVVLSDKSDFETEIHEVRKRCKELRAVARLIQPDLTKSYGRFDMCIRDAARKLSEARDAHVVVTTIKQVDIEADIETTGQLERIREHRVGVAAEALATLRNSQRHLRGASSNLREAGRISAGWNVHEGFEALATGIAATYRGARKGLARLRRTNDNDDVHELRKSVKNLWYQTRLIELSAPSVLGPFATTLHTLSELLGDDHDRSILIERIRSDRKRYGGKSAVQPAIRLARDQQMTIRSSALRLAATVLAEDDVAFGSRIRTYSRLTQDFGAEPRALR